MSSCNITRMVPDDEYLLRRNKTKISESGFDKEELTGMDLAEVKEKEAGT